MKRLTCLIFVLILAAMNATGQMEECDTYEDCPSIGCVGYSRSCFAGECKYSECFLETDEKPTIEKDSWGIWGIIVVAGRVFLVVISVLVLALLLAAFGKFSFIRNVVSVAVIILVIIGVLFFAGRSESVMQFLGLQKEVEDPVKPVIAQMARDIQHEMTAYDIKESVDVLYSGIVEAKEYKLQGDDEISIVVVAHDGKMKNYPPGAGEKVSIANTIVDFRGDSIIASYWWRSGGMLYYVSGKPSSIRKVSSRMIQSNVKFEEAIGLPVIPVIIDVIPKNGSKTVDRTVSFAVRNADSVNVDLIQGWTSMEDHCEMQDMLICSFDMTPIEGVNRMRISAMGGGRTASEVYTFVFDETPPVILGLPEGHVVFVNFAIRISDEAGIDRVDLYIDDSFYQPNCNLEESSMVCSLSVDDLSEGKHDVMAIAYDALGNSIEESTVIIYDATKPEIRLKPYGFDLYDPHGVDLNTLMVDNKKFDPENCNYVSGTYECSYNTFISSISIRDYAGNSAYSEFKKSR